MIKFSKHTVFDTPAQTIVNTVNCLGVMGGGLALEFKLRFPYMYLDYVDQCKKNEILTGKITIYKKYNPWILNFPTKKHWKYPSKLEWIEEGLLYFCEHYIDLDIESIAFPKLGCDRGGLEWEFVQKVMIKYLNSIDIDVFICLDEEIFPLGIEKRMVENLKNADFLLNFVKLSEKQTFSIINNSSLNRFRDLLKIESIGKKTYEKIFKNAYSIALDDQKEDPPKFEQLLLFQ